MIEIPFGPDRIKVAPPGVEAWRALAQVLAAHDYMIRIKDTDSYACRMMKAGKGKSLHSYGIALDINWDTNPLKKTPDNRPVKYSEALNQSDRARDVKRGVADTDMTKDMVEDVLAIETEDGQQVFRWGGDWNSVKDTMHFELAVSPEELQAGIDWGTVRTTMSSSTGGSDRPPTDDDAPGASGDGDGDGDGVDIDLGELFEDDGDDDEVIGPGSDRDKVRALQESLARLNYHVGDFDGLYGPLTRAAVLAFQNDNDLEPSGVIDAATRSVLAIARQRPLSPGREYESVDGLRDKGSQIISLTDWLRKLALTTGVLGVLGLSSGDVDIVNGFFDSLERVVATSQSVETTPDEEEGEEGEEEEGAEEEAEGDQGIVGVIESMDTLKGGLGIAAIIAAVFFWRNAREIAERRVKEHRDGANLDV